MRGHGAEVKCCDWHPQKGLIVSGSKDTQQPIKLWDPRVGQSLTTLYVYLFCFVRLAILLIVGNFKFTGQ